MATRIRIPKEALITIWTNTKIMYWFVCYYLARAIRPFFTWGKPISFAEFVNNPKHTLTEIILEERP